MIRLALLISTAGGAGYVPFAPGTIGSLVGLAVFALVRASGLAIVEAAVLVACAVVGTWAATHAEHRFGVQDPGPIVIDEVLGMLVTLAFLQVSWTGALAGFLLFRFFDIVKPWPAARLEGLRGGPGIMADDVVAGVYAHLALRGALWLAPGWLT